jgi:hypothetical protein
MAADRLAGALPIYSRQGLAGRVSGRVGGDVLASCLFADGIGDGSGPLPMAEVTPTEISRLINGVSAATADAVYRTCSALFKRRRRSPTSRSRAR